MDPLLGLLQLTDSGFPSGAFTLSHGLETLVADGAVRSVDDVAAFLHVSLLDRLARADLVVLVGVHAATGLDAVIELDRRLSTVKLAAGERTASERVGRRLAIEASRLATDELLATYCAALDARRTPGNAATSLGLALRAFRVPARDAAIAAAWGFANGLCTAAVRLGVIGHGDAQRVLREAAPIIERAVTRAMETEPGLLRPSGPQLEVALARHETADAHLFAT
jgi:urease accessory protein